MKLSRTTLVALALIVAAVVAATVMFNQPAGDQNGVAGDGTAGGSKDASSTGAPHPSPRRASRSAVAETKPLAVRELELLWARGRGGELLAELDKVSTNKDPDYWREVSPLLITQAAKEGRPDVANYLLATADAAPAETRIGIYAAAMDNADENLRETARLELENITGEDFANGQAARAWLAAHPQRAEVEEEMPEDQ